jgi:hypothetical protein
MGQHLAEKFIATAFQKRYPAVSFPQRGFHETDKQPLGHAVESAELHVCSTRERSIFQDLHQLIPGSKNAIRVLESHFAGLGEDERSLSPVKKNMPQRLLELPKLRREGGLAEPQLFCGLRYASLVSDGPWPVIIDRA